MTTQHTLVADIGGTNIRFALVDAEGQLLQPATYPWVEPYSITIAAQDYLQRTGARPRRAAFSCASGADGLKFVHIINVGPTGWTWDVEETRNTLALEQLYLLNDFMAVALSVTGLGKDDLVKVCGGQAQEKAAVAVLGAGTGLGCSGLVWSGQHYTAIEGEGGHMTMAAYNEDETRILAALRQDFPHVSAERVLSGMGIENLYRAVCEVDGLPLRGLSAPSIMEQGIAGTDPACRRAIDLFCAFFGTIAGDLILALGAKGGLYIGGGIIPRFIPYFAASKFPLRLVDKGRYRDYISAVPVYVITHSSPGLIGAKEYLKQKE